MRGWRSEGGGVEKRGNHLLQEQGVKSNVNTTPNQSVSGRNGADNTSFVNYYFSRGKNVTLKDLKIHLSLMLISTSVMSS